jgi:anti-sigma B factor antagonist
MHRRTTGANMTIQERVVGSVTVLDCDGRLVLGDGDALLKDKIHSLMFQSRKQILLNMGGISYLDSSGLGALVAASVTTNNNGGELKLLHLTKRLHDLLSISKLLTVFETYDDEAEAVRSFAAQARA